jgi:amino acid permease
MSRIEKNITPPDYPEDKSLQQYNNSQEIYAAEDVQPRMEETHRSLKPRQISMIAIGECWFYSIDIADWE